VENCPLLPATLTGELYCGGPRRLNYYGKGWEVRVGDQEKKRVRKIVQKGL